jgi:SAM-dependent methyltransferase
MTAKKTWRQSPNLATCPNCGFIAADLAQWRYPYSNHDYYETIDRSAINPGRPYITHRINQILKHVGSGRAVDLGCGLGETAIAMEQAGFDAHGVEESRNAINILQKEYEGVHWHNMSIVQYLEDKKSIFDVISFFHVLEHIPNPRMVCQLAADALRPSGLLVVEVPDVAGGQALLRGKHWQHWLPHHVNYFSSNTLRKLFFSLGLIYAGMETKYHMGYPQGIEWRDAMHRTLANLGLNDIITTYWHKAA